MQDNTGHSFEAYFKRAAAPLVVLRLLLEKPMYGYEISQLMDQRSGGEFAMSLLYPVLYRLEKQGYIRVCETEVVNGRARSYYGVTEEGKRYYQETTASYQRMNAAFQKIIGEETP